MKPVDEEELHNIKIDFLRFMELKNSDLKSAYLAVSGRGFTNIVQSKHDAVMMERETDHKYVVCSYPFKPEQIIIKKERIIRFHTEKEIFS